MAATSSAPASTLDAPGMTPHPVRLVCYCCHESMMVLVSCGISEEGWFETRDPWAVRWINSHIEPRAEML